MVETEERPSRAGPWVLVAGGAAVAVAGSVLLALGQSARSSVEDAPVGSSWPEVSGDYDSAAPLGNAGIAGLGIGVAAAAIGVVLLVASGEKEGSSVEVSAGAQGLVVRGRF